MQAILCDCYSVGYIYCSSCYQNERLSSWQMSQCDGVIRSTDGRSRDVPVHRHSQRIAGRVPLCSWNDIKHSTLISTSHQHRRASTTTCTCLFSWLSSAPHNDCYDFVYSLIIHCLTVWRKAGILRHPFPCSILVTALRGSSRTVERSLGTQNVTFSNLGRSASM